MSEIFVIYWVRRIRSHLFKSGVSLKTRITESPIDSVIISEGGGVGDDGVIIIIHILEQKRLLEVK